MYDRKGGTSTSAVLRRSFCGWQATRIAERAPQKEFDLGIDAAQIVRGPSPDGVEQLWIDPEQEGLARAHV